MAVRFDASTDRLLRTSDLLDYNGVYTWMAWIYLVSDLNASSTFWVLSDNSANNRDYLFTTGTGTTLRLNVVIGGGATNVDGTDISAGVWYHLALVRESATAVKVYLNGVLDITNTRDITGRASATRMEHGAFSSSNTNRSDSRVAAIKAWSTNLSQVEILNEMRVIKPCKTTNLYGYWPTLNGSEERVRDYSGNGRDWTEGGTLTDEDSPPIVMNNRMSFVVTPSVMITSQTATHKADTRLTKTQSASYQAYAVLSKTQTLTTQSDTRLTKTQTATVQTYARLTKTQSPSHVAYVALSTTRTTIHTADAILTKTQTATHITDANLLKTQTATTQVFGVQTKTQTVSHIADVVLTSITTHTATYQVDVVLTDLGDVTGDIQLLAIYSLSVALIGRIKATESLQGRT